VTHFTSDRIFHFDWSRDGRLALSRGTDLTDAVLIKNFSDDGQGGFRTTGS
jgi:hypothetical protein